jgi:hypothetical protein
VTPLEKYSFMKPGNWYLLLIAAAALTHPGCSQEERGPILAGGRKVKSWLDALSDPKPTVRRQAVLKLGNVGDADPAVPGALGQAIRDSDATVRRDALGAIAKLRNPSEDTLAWIKIMSDRDPDAKVRDYAKRTIAHFEKAK